MRVKGPTNAYVWHTWVLGEVGDVGAVVELGKLDGKHLSMMLSLVSTDPAALTKRRWYRSSQHNTLQLHLASATTCFS
jgi:hypothetical protein